MCNTSGKSLPRSLASPQQSSLPSAAITSTSVGSLQNETKPAGGNSSDVWTCKRTQDEDFKRMIAATARVNSARSALDGIERRETEHLVLNDFTARPDDYDYTPQHRELYAALEHKDKVFAADLAHVRRHGDEPYAHEDPCDEIEIHNDDGSLITGTSSSLAKEDGDCGGGTEDDANTTASAAEN